LAAVNREFRPAVVPDINPEQAGFEDVDRGVGRMDLEILLPIQLPDAEIDTAAEKVDLGRLAIPGRESGHIDLGIQVETQDVAPAELDLGPAVARP